LPAAPDRENDNPERGDETMTITKHFTAADFAAALAAGGTTVCKHIAGTVSVRITMERDFDGDIPSPEVYSEADIAAWEAGEWTDWCLDLSVLVGNYCIAKCVSSIGGVDCVDDGYANPDHLADIANDLVARANVPQIVRAFANRMSEAAAMLDAT
jgi:hypothetical protein